MRLPGPFSDDTWDWLPHSEEARPSTATAANSASRVLWELGLVLCVPLAGAGLVELLLETLRIY